MRKTVDRIGLASLCILAMTSCAEERAPINRVQANALDKHFFAGKSLVEHADDPEFYFRNYVIDAQANQSLIGVGSWSAVDRIRWEITEKTLIARKAYELAGGADGHGAAGKTPNGTIVAVYGIESHFDIRRDYNPTTGEESNILGENTGDRPWYEREYMRVDWSQNRVEDPMWEEMFLGNVMGTVTVSPVVYAGTDPNADDAPHFEPDDGYFDVTNHYVIEPALTNSPFSDVTGKVPTCMVIGMFTGSATYDCYAQEAVVRSSFWKIGPDRDFEPLENTRAPLDVVGNPGGTGTSSSVGIVTAGQQGWDPGYGYTDPLYHRFAHVHDVWQKSHQDVACEAPDDADGNGTADACENELTGHEGASGSQCDVFVGKCTIPYRDRAIKTVGYWLNRDLPDFLQDPAGGAKAGAARGAAEEVIHSWDQLMAGAVARAREVECRRTGDGDREACHARFFEPEKVMVSHGGWLTEVAKDPVPVVTLCHNPVRSEDLHETCGEIGYSARLGDLRRNFLSYWPHESRAPWGGIANWSADPLTGEIIGAAAWVMGRSVTYAAAMQRDILQVAMGDTSLGELLQGVPAELYARAAQDGAVTGGLSAAEIDRRVASVDAARVMEAVRPVPLAGATIAEKYGAFVDLQRSSSADPLVQSTAQLEHDALVQPLLGSKYEAQMVDSHWLVGALGADPDTDMNDAALAVASPLRGLDPGRLHAFRDLVQQKMRQRGVCFFDTEAPIVGSVEMQGLARHFRDKYAGLDKKARGEAIYQDLAIEAFKGVAVHEVGHSLGLLHQFASSWDAPNYNPQYWQLRTGEGTATASCNGQPRAGDADTCMGPRYLDPETLDEQGLAGESRPGILYFGNSSVMEYQIERFGETVGLGPYDRHAMNVLYGRVLETMDDAEHGGLAVRDQKRFAPRLESQINEQDRVVRTHPQFGKGTWSTHYTEVARQMKVFDPARDCREATEAEKQIAGFRIVHGKVCAPPPRDHAAWRDFASDAIPGGGQAPYWHTRSDGRMGGERVRWFYRYGTTHNSYFHTNDNDAGADPYEVTRSAVRRFEVSYPFAYFRRQNREYNYQSIPASVSDRYFERMRSYHWLVAHSTAFYRSFGEEIFGAIAGDDDWHRPYLVAEQDMLDLLMRSVLMPEPGDYAPQAVVGQTRPIFDLPDRGAGAFEIGLIDGRFLSEELDSGPEAGGSWDYGHWMVHAGFSTEKTLALRALMDGRPSLFTVGRESALDGRGLKISFRSDHAAAIDRLLGGVLAEDWETVAPWVSPSDGKTPRVRLLDLTSEVPSREPDAPILFPNVGYRQQLSALVFAGLFARLDVDPALVNKMRLWIDGEASGVEVPAEQQARFYNPATGYTYIARRYGKDVIDGKVVDEGIASRMIAHANDLLVASYEVETDAAGEPVLDAHGSPVLRLDQDGQPVLKDADHSAISKLDDYVELLDAARQIGQALGYGPARE